MHPRVTHFLNAGLSLFQNNIFIPLLFVSLCLNVWFVHDNFALRGQLDFQTGLLPGVKVSPFRVKSLSGGPTEVVFSTARRGTLLYFFRPGCGWCLKNQKNFAELSERLHGDFEILAYTDVPTTVVDMRKLLLGGTAQIVTDADQDIIRMLKLGGTPQTILFDRQGTVLQSWEGAYAGQLSTQIETYFRMKLPGLKESLATR